MASDTTIIHFGNFLRWKFQEAGGIAYACRKVNLATPTAERFCRAADPEAINMRPENRDKLVAALAFKDWPTLDAAWRKTSLAPFPVKQNMGAYNRHLEETGQLRFLGGSPRAVVDALSKLSREALVEALKTVPADVLDEVTGARPAQGPPHQSKGLLLNHQIDALAQAKDVETFDQVVKEIRRQLRAKSKK